MIKGPLQSPAEVPRNHNLFALVSVIEKPKLLSRTSKAYLEILDLVSRNADLPLFHRTSKYIQFPTSFIYSMDMNNIQISSLNSTLPVQPTHGLLGAADPVGLSDAMLIQYLRLRQAREHTQQSQVQGASSLLASSRLLMPTTGPRKLIKKRTRTLNDQQKFLIFTKAVFQLLKLSGNEQLRQRVKNIVTVCTRRNRMGDPSFTPLQSAVETHVRSAVGDEFYMKLQVYLDRYCQQRGLNPSAFH